jgi:carboxypeptidase C (cathepsin A)
VGYSYGPRQVSTSEQAASDLYFAIQYFFRAFPQYLPNPFFISGESYAGKYVPLTSYEVLKGNAAIRAPWKKINLQGCAIGNGWVHPITQNQAYVDYPYNLGLIGEKQHDEAQKIMNELRISILSEDWLKAQDLSNDLENVVVSNAGVDEDNILYDFVASLRPSSPRV